MPSKNVFASLSLMLMQVLVLVVSQSLTRNDLRVQLEVYYPPEKTPFIAFALKGNGLGLSWNTSAIMEQQNDEKTWSKTLVYEETPNGYFCQECPLGPELVKAVDPREGLVFRVLGVKADGSEVEMRGPNFRIQLPISKSSTYFKRLPTFLVRPFFDEQGGTFKKLTVSSNNEHIGSNRSTWLFLPPSFQENPKTVYDVVYLFDYGPQHGEMLTQKLNEIFKENIASDFVVIGFGDYQDNPDPLSDRRNLLTPIRGVIAHDCINGTLDDDCNGCITEPIEGYDNLIYWLTEGGCGREIFAEGRVNETIDYLLDEVFPLVNNFVLEQSGGKSRLTTDPTKTAILGFSLGGLASCHAGWTRPNNFGTVACSSASFWYPKEIHEPGLMIHSEFYFLNVTLNQNCEGRPRQKYIIDVGGGEGGTLLEQVNSAIEVYDKLDKIPDGNGRVILQVYPEETHSYEAWGNRLWNVIGTVTQHLSDYVEIVD